MQYQGRGNEIKTFTGVDDDKRLNNDFKNE